MNRNETNPTLTEADDFLHQATDELKWRESYYFNWVDLKNKVSGFSTIGIIPNEQKRELVFILFFDNKMEAYYKENISEPYVSDINSMLKDGNLAYEIIIPLKRWQIHYKCRKFELNLVFNTRFLPYNFGGGSSASWHGHFESSGLLTGFLRFKNGITREIRGFGQRDKSWGYRDWHQFDKWYAAHFQFDHWSCGFRKDYHQDRIDLSGFISKISANKSISQLEIDTINDTDQFQSPLTSTYIITDIEGNLLTIQSKRIEKHTFMRFIRTFPEGYTELFEQMVIMKSLETGEIGTGMTEYLRTIKNI